MLSEQLHARQKGDIGEKIALRFLVKRGFSIVEKNYFKKWGEIDIIAKKGKNLHFIEVKSTTIDSLRPEENVHVLKRKRLRRIIQTYLFEKKYDPEDQFFFHVLVVHMNMSHRRAKVSMIENVIL